MFIQRRWRHQIVARGLFYSPNCIYVSVITGLRDILEGNSPSLPSLYTCCNIMSMQVTQPNGMASKNIVRSYGKEILVTVGMARDCELPWPALIVSPWLLTRFMISVLVLFQGWVKCYYTSETPLRSFYFRIFFTVGYLLDRIHFK